MLKNEFPLHYFNIRPLSAKYAEKGRQILSKDSDMKRYEDITIKQVNSINSINNIDILKSKIKNLSLEINNQYAIANNGISFLKNDLIKNLKEMKKLIYDYKIIEKKFNEIAKREDKVLEFKKLLSDTKLKINDLEQRYIRKYALLQNYPLDGYEEIYEIIGKGVSIKNNNLSFSGISNLLIESNPSYNGIVESIFLDDNSEYIFLESSDKLNADIPANFVLQKNQITVKDKMNSSFMFQIDLKVSNKKLELLNKLNSDSITTLLEIHIKTANLLEISVHNLITNLEIDSFGIVKHQRLSYNEMLQPLINLTASTKTIVTKSISKLEKTSNSSRSTNSNPDNSTITNSYTVKLPVLQKNKKNFLSNYSNFSQTFLKNLFNNLDKYNTQPQIEIYDKNPVRIKVFNEKGLITQKYWESFWITSQQGTEDINSEITIFNIFDGKYIPSIFKLPPNQSDFDRAMDLKNGFPEECKRILNQYKDYILENVNK